MDKELLNGLVEAQQAGRLEAGHARTASLLVRLEALLDERAVARREAERRPLQEG